MRKSLVINQEQIADVKNILNRAYYPLDGFLRKKDFISVVSNMRLSGGQVWPIPIVLDAGRGQAIDSKKEKELNLIGPDKKPVALLKEIEIYKYNKRFLAENVFGTLDENHPGVENIFKMNNYLIGGRIEKAKDLMGKNKRVSLFDKYNLTPSQTRDIFKRRGWRKIVAFQTRNIPHRSHEALQKLALRQVDGLFVQPVIGWKKTGDFLDDVIIKSYEILVDRYYPKGKVQLGILPLKMRYAGPREAIFHALIRKNYGCTHMIVGRDHAGIGNYYSSFAAQEIFSNFLPEEIGIDIVKFDNFVYCQMCKKFISQSKCSHLDKDKLFLSGTKIRELIKEGQPLPKRLIRKEISDLLLNYPSPFVD